MMYNYPFFSFPNFRNYRPHNIIPNNQMQHFNYEQINKQKHPHTLEEVPRENTKYNKRHTKKEDKIAVKASFNDNNSNNNNKNNNTTNNTNKNNYNNSKNYNKAKTIENAGITKNARTTRNETDVLFEIFGIKLYFDDILLISLIFFLYSEGVKDDYLFISLILLLLS